MWSCVRAATQVAPDWAPRGGAAAACQIVCEEGIYSSEPGICIDIAILCDFIS